MKKIGIILALCATLFVGSNLFGRGLVTADLGVSGFVALPMTSGESLDQIISKERLMNNIDKLGFGLDASVAVSIVELNFQPMFVNTDLLKYTILPVNAMIRLDFAGVSASFGGGVAYYMASAKSGLPEKIVESITKISKNGKDSFGTPGYTIKLEVGIPVWKYIKLKPFVYVLTSPGAENPFKNPTFLGGITFSGLLF